MGLKGIIPSLLHHTLLGYNFLIPDAVGNTTAYGSLFSPLIALRVLHSLPLYENKKEHYFSLVHKKERQRTHVIFGSKMSSCNIINSTASKTADACKKTIYFEVEKTESCHDRQMT